MNEQLKILVAAILDKAMSESNINSQLKQLKIDNLKLNVDINSSTATIKTEVQKAAQKVNQYIKSSVVTPINIPFQFDTTSSSKMQAEMNKIVKSISGNKGNLVDYKINTSMVLDDDKESRIEKLTGATLQYKNALNELVTTEIKYQQISTQTNPDGSTESIMGWSTASQQYHQNIEKTIALQQKQADEDAKVARGKAELAKQMDIVNAKTNKAGIQLNPENQAQFQSKIDSATTIKDLQEVSHYLKMAKLEYQELNAAMTKDLPNNALDNANKKLANMSPAIDILQSKFQMLGQSMPKGIDKTFDGLKQDLNDIVNTADPQEKIDKFNKLSASIQKLNVDLRQIKQEQTKSKFDSSLGLGKIKLDDRITIWLNKNQKSAKMFGTELANIQAQIQGADRLQLANLNKQFQNVQKSAERLGVSGRTVFGELKNNISKFGSWFLIGGGVASAVRSFTSAITELKEIDTQLTEISKTSELTTQQLKELGNASFDAANKYGATVIGYLEGVREFSRAGKENAQALAEVSILAQSAGDLTADTANKYLLATDAAYALGGSEERLTEVLDAQNQVTNRNAVNMEQLAQATMVAGSQAAQSGIDVDELTAAVSTMAIVTQQGGDIAGRAFKGILMNLQQVSGELENGEIIDEESFKKVEKSLNEVGVSMSTVVDGAVRMREPMEILKELSQVYNSLDDLDPKKSAIISDLGGKYRGNQLAALLSNWETYEKVLSDYTNSTGSALREAQKTADSWEGRLNRLTNTWNGFIANFVDSDTFKGAITSGETFIKVLDGLVNTLGAIPTLATAVAAALSFKNVGWLKMLSDNKYAHHNLIVILNESNIKMVYLIRDCEENSLKWCV